MCLDMGLVERRVLIVEDDTLLASLVTTSLQEAGFEVRTAVSSLEARKQIKSFDPDLVLLDLDLGEGPSGVHLAHVLSDQRPDIAILVLTKHAHAQSVSPKEDDLPESVGFIRKQSVTAPPELLAAIEKVLADRPFEVRQDHDSAKPFSNLPPRAQEVLRLLASGCSNQEIARRTNMSLKTVEKWVDRIYQELSIENTSAVNARVSAANRYFAETRESDKP
jgi:DNA-binding NarL/FixJ family response regulator